MGLSAKATAELLDLILDRKFVTVWAVDVEGRITSVRGRHDIIDGKSNKGRLLADVVGRDSDVWRYHERALAGETVNAHVKFAAISFDASYTPMRDETGAIIGVLGISSDVTEHMTAASELRKTEAMNALIIDTIPGGVVFVATDGSILQANATATDILGLTLDELTGRYVSDFESETILADGSPCPMSEYPVVRCLETGLAQPPTTIGVRRKDKPLRWALFSAVPAHHPDTGDMIGAIVTFLDITAQREAEETRRELEGHLARSQRLESVGRLAGGIAHDFNNLLVAILGHADLLRTELEPGTEQRESAETIAHAASRAARLTEQLLGFARRGKRTQEPVDLDERIRVVCRLLDRTIDKRIRVQHRAVGGGAWVEGDPAQIEQVLLNLALNARDVMRDGGLLSFETRVVERDGTERVEVAVRDTGGEIPPEVRAQIFEPFFTTKPQGEGTGMGLAVAYGIARNHGGWLRLESTGPEGTSFVLDLPRIELKQMAAPEAAAVVPPAGSAHVLLVDDEPIVRDVAARHLQRLGHRVTVAPNAYVALEKYTANPTSFDLVMLDLMMPKMRGDECFEEMRAVNPEVRVLLCTGVSDDGVASIATASGMMGCLAKPYSVQELERAINAALGD